MKIQYIKDVDRNKEFNILVGSIEVKNGLLKNDTILPIRIVEGTICIPLMPRDPINQYQEFPTVDKLGNLLTQSIWNNANIRQSETDYSGEIIVRKSTLPAPEGFENFIFTGLTNKHKNDITEMFQNENIILYKNIFFANNTRQNSFDQLPNGNNADAWFSSTFNWGFEKEPLQIFSTLNLSVIELTKEMNLLRIKDDLTQVEKDRIKEINRITDGIFGQDGVNNDKTFKKYLQELSKDESFNNFSPQTRENFEKREENVKTIIAKIINENDEIPSMKM